jgi:hypothetical protein
VRLPTYLTDRKHRLLANACRAAEIALEAAWRGETALAGLRRTVMHEFNEELDISIRTRFGQ